MKIIALFEITSINNHFLRILKMCRISHVDFFGSLALFVFESIIFEGKGLDKVFDELKFTETEKSFEKFSKL